MMDVTHYVFYHNKASLTKVKPSVENADICYVNLDELELPKKLKIDGLSEGENRAIYSEFLGILTMQPKTDMVGVFTYSIPYKYSYDFAKELKYPLKKHGAKWMLPPIKFDYLTGKNYDKTKLYGAYFRPYVFADDPANSTMEDIDRHPHLHIAPTDGVGPFNGTVIVSRERFLMFQKWLWKVVEYLMKRYGWECGIDKDDDSENMKEAGIAKGYDKSGSAEFDKKFRRGMGHVLERCLAYYFGRSYSVSDRVDMKQFLNDKTKLYIFSSPSHEYMKNEFFLSSIKDDFEIVEERHNQSCGSGEYHSDGWDSIVHQKINLIIRAIHENWGNWFIHSDIDVQFFGKVKNLLKRELSGRDIVFQNDCPFPRPVACAGFFACRGNIRTLFLWESIKRMCIREKIDDQHALNRILHNKNHRINEKLVWRFLPLEFYSPGAVSAHFLKIDEKRSIAGKGMLAKLIKFDHKWRWNTDEVTPAGDYIHPTMRELYVPHNIVLHHANYTEGIGNKVKQLNYVRDVVRGRKK